MVRKRDRTREYARNKVRRALTRLEKQVEKQRGDVRAETNKEIRTLRKAIENSFYNRDTKSYTLATDKLTNIATTSRERVEKFERYLHVDSAAVNRRKTMQMEAYFRRSAYTEAQREGNLPKTPEQRLIRAEQNFFYRKTQTIWQGNVTDMNLRNEYIINTLKESGITLKTGRLVQNLTDAVDYVKEMFPSEYPTMDKIKENPNYGDDFDNGEESIETSPEKLKYTELVRLGVKL